MSKAQGKFDFSVHHPFKMYEISEYEVTKIITGMNNSKCIWPYYRFF